MNLRDLKSRQTINVCLQWEPVDLKIELTKFQIKWIPDKLSAKNKTT